METTPDSVVILYQQLKDELNQHNYRYYVLDDPSAMGARNSIAAAAQILDRTGLVKKEQVEVKNTGGAMFILPPKSDD